MNARLARWLSMRALLRRIALASFALLLPILAIARGSGTRSEPAPSSCELPSRMHFVVGDRADGIYGVIGDAVGDAPLLRFTDMIRTEHGVDAESKKPWFQFRLSGDAPRALREFSATPSGRSILVIVGGRVAARHKIRQPLDGDGIQVSCCDPRACERWTGNVASSP
jgi:hypothetical protein